MVSVSAARLITYFVCVMVRIAAPIAFELVTA
jgi:hypothetical protein